MLSEILRIQAEGFEYGRQGEILKYGYCIYYLRPDFSVTGLEKRSVIYSIAIDREFRNRGFGRKLLEESIKEMKMNSVSAICLYVNINNLPAIKLYEKIGFSIIKEIKDICGPVFTNFYRESFYNRY
ncbi:GNAT family N-acetyltransferase [Methanosarcina mazei]|nr:N-acetyltransferase [Methanosarcina mazei]